MGLWSRLRGRKKPTRKGPEPAVRPASPRKDRLFLNSDEAGRPVDLSGSLEASGGESDWRRALERRIAEAGAAAGEPARAYLDALQRELGSGTLSLPAMPRSVLRVQRLVDSPNCRTEDLAREIELDPALSTKLVGIANSPFYAGLEPVNAVRDALVRIGMSETRNIVLAIALRSKVFQVSGYEQETASLWRHSVAASVAARALAAEVGIDPDAGFLSGLVHDVGRAVLLSVTGALRARSHGALVPTPEVLGEVLASIHPLVSAVAADSWRFAPVLVEALACHHAPADASEAARPLARVLEAADLLARRLAHPAQGEVPGDEAAAAALEALGLERDSIEEFEAELSSAFETLSKSL